MHAHDVLPEALGAVGGRAVDPGGDLARIALMNVPAEVGRDLQSDLDFVRFEPALHLLGGLSGFVWDVVSGALEGRDVARLSGD